MENFQDIFETHKWSFVSAFSISMTVPLRNQGYQFSVTCWIWVVVTTTFIFFYSYTCDFQLYLELQNFPYTCAVYRKSAGSVSMLDT